MYKLMQSLLLLLIGTVAMGREEFPICITSGQQEFPAVASDGNNYLVVWEDVRTGSYDIWGQRISATGDTLGQFPICKAAGQQFSSAVAWGGSNYLVAWIEYSGGSHNIYGRLLSPTGDTLGPTFFIGTCGTAYFQEFPVIAWNGSNYLVVWSSPIYGQLVSPTGDTLGQFPICTGNWDQLSPSVAWDSTNFLVVWSDYRTGEHDIYGQRVSAQGDTLGEFPICIANEGQWRPEIVWNGTNYLVVWDDERGGPLAADIYGEFVSPEGDTLGQFAVCKESDFQAYSAVAWDGANYLVVWLDLRSGIDYDIWSQWVSPGGDTLGQFPICKAGGYQYFPDVAWNGTSYLVVWEDARNYDNTQNDIYGKLIPSIGVAEQNKVSVVISRLDIYPNPFDKFTVISCEIPVNGEVSLQIYDISGRLVKTLIHGTKEVGTYSTNWDANGIPYGIYFLQLKTQEKIITKKVVRMK